MIILGAKHATCAFDDVVDIVYIHKPLFAGKREIITSSFLLVVKKNQYGIIRSLFKRSYGPAGLDLPDEGQAIIRA